MSLSKVALSQWLLVLHLNAQVIEVAEMNSAVFIVSLSDCFCGQCEKVKYDEQRFCR